MPAGRCASVTEKQERENNEVPDARSRVSAIHGRNGMVISWKMAAIGHRTLKKESKDGLLTSILRWNLRA